MKVPEWADPTLSKDMPVLRAQGENQDLEYMEEFPNNARELGKEIAAFATSNAGTILLGISKVGDLVGLPDSADPTVRDELLRRLEGICHGTIKPSITPTAKYAIQSGKVVLVVTVPKGRAPIYYCHGVPYLRHITEARPAEPHEVLELVREHLEDRGLSTPSDPDSAVNALLSELGHVLINVLIAADEAEERMVNPWLELWRSEFEYAAAELRELAIQDTAVDEGIDEELQELASALDEVGNFRLYLGAGSEFIDLVKKAAGLANRLKTALIDSLPLDTEAPAVARDVLVKSSRRLAGLVGRSLDMAEEGRIEEVQAEASDVGKQLLQLSHYRIGSLDKTAREALRDVGKKLHLLETERVFMDGGKSVQGILDQLADCLVEVNRLVASIEPGEE